MHTVESSPSASPERSVRWRRRHCLRAAAAFAGTLAWPLRATTEPSPSTLAPLRAGGVVVAFRHALAPGAFDPPGFRLGECSTQRNLSDEGRAQARRIGAWFAEHRLVPAAVKSSPWCRCMETARLAFGRVQAWDPLSSPRFGSDSANAERVSEMRRSLSQVREGRFEVWVTHQFTLDALVGESTSSGEGLLLRGTGADRAPELLARLVLG